MSKKNDDALECGCITRNRNVSVKRTTDGKPAAIQNMRVNHRRLDIFVTKQFLYGSDIVAILKQMRGEGMTKCMTTHWLGDASAFRSLVDRALQRTVALMEAAEDAIEAIF